MHMFFFCSLFIPFDLTFKHLQHDVKLNNYHFWHSAYLNEKHHVKHKNAKISIFNTFACILTVYTYVAIKRNSFLKHGSYIYIYTVVHICKVMFLRHLQRGVAINLCFAFIFHFVSRYIQ